MSAGSVLTRESLSFTERNEQERLLNWLPGARDQWERDLVKGRERFAEVRRLALCNPMEARQAILYAITSQSWGAEVMRGFGTEFGFAEALAHAAVMHLRGSPGPRREHVEQFRALRSRGACIGGRS